MKAQAARRSLWFLDFALAAALVGVGAWWFLEVRPASAAGPKGRTAWVEGSWKVYDKQAKEVAPAIIYPVNEEALKNVTRPDLKEVGVGAFVGPIPPEPKPPEKPVEAPPQPKGIEAIGKATSIFWMPPAPPGTDPRDVLATVVEWQFPSKKTRRFAVGDFVRETDAEKGRFQIKSVLHPQANEPVYKIVYDVFDDPAKDPVQRAQEFVADLRPTGAGTGPIRIGNQPEPTGTGPTPAGTAGGTPPGAPPGSVVNTAYVVVGDTRVEAKITRVPVDGSQVSRYELDEAAYKYFSQTNGESLLSDVKTEEARDERGNVKGIMLTSFPENSLTSAFDIRRGDVLVSINGTAVHNRGEAIDVVKRLPKDVASVRVVIDRNARQIAFDVDPRDPAVRKAAGTVGYRGPR
jgi:hypothetical protein